jgi:AAA+ ATPase superfamily predicted ATPase
LVFQSSRPVTASGFFDREAELARLEEAARRLLAGAPTWLAILGLRKIGKTSLLLGRGGGLTRRRRCDLSRS